MDVYCDRPSKSARALATGLGGIRIRNTGSIHRGEVVINWGTTTAWPVELMRPINPPIPVTVASNKLSFLQAIEDLAICPSFTTTRDRALMWLNDRQPVVCRTLLNASGGRGIVIAERLGQIVDAPLYVKYIKKTEEFRVHIFDGNIIDVQRKARVLDHPEPNWKVRNLEGGFIYAREGVEEYAYINAIKEAALAAYERMEGIGLDFGAFDVIKESYTHRPYVLEVNTAPGLMGTTLERYVTYLQQRAV